MGESEEWLSWLTPEIAGYLTSPGVTGPPGNRPGDDQVSTNLSQPSDPSLGFEVNNTSADPDMGAPLVQQDSIADAPSFVRESSPDLHAPVHDRKPRRWQR
jgi:hypothetical protein